MDAPLVMGAGDGAVRSVFLETHIDNPTESPTIIDAGWGARLWYTDQLMEEESAVFGLYVGIPLLGIPPGEGAYEIVGECLSGCTTMLPETGIKISATAPHMHAAATAAWIQVIRNGVEIGEMFRQDAWDANWQGPRFRGKETELVVLPGDRLIGHCIYNTIGRTEPTMFGEGYMDEMCMFYVSYYPRTDLTTCTEWPARNPDDHTREAIFSLCNAAPWFAADSNRSYTPMDQPPNNCQVRS